MMSMAAATDLDSVPTSLLLFLVPLTCAIAWVALADWLRALSLRTWRLKRYLSNNS
jgi:hypothetical protein